MRIKMERVSRRKVKKNKREKKEKEVFSVYREVTVPLP